MPKKIKKRLSKDDHKSPKKHPKKALRDAGLVGEGIYAVPKLRHEMDQMLDVLMGRVDPPVSHGVLTLMEVADAYFARAKEMTIHIHRMEADGEVKKGDPLYRFRTGELRDFMELAKEAADLGSRRLTKESLMFEQSRTGRESRGGI